MSNVIDSIKLSGTVYTLSAQTEGGGVPESAFTAYTASTNERISQDEEVTAAALNVLNESLSGKQDTLSAGTNITISGNVISAEGGGKAIEAGRGITVTTGETADTISLGVPIYSGTGINALKLNYSGNTANGKYSVAEGSGTTANEFYSHAEGYGTRAGGNMSHAEGRVTNASGYASHAEGDSTVASGETSHAEGLGTRAGGNSSHAEGWGTWAIGNDSHSEGVSTNANGIASHAEGRNTVANNRSEHASGQYNVSNSATTTFGDSGNTLFSVGNGTADNARHNAFEIRQNGDIYLTSGGTDIKLQDHLGGSSITVDTALDSGSTNPVENRVIYNKIDEVEEVTAAGLNALNDKITPTVELTQAQYDALVTAGTVSADTYYIITDAQAGDLTNYYTKSETNTLLGGKADTATTYTKTEVDNALGGKQATLVSGTNIKTINNESILGSGNIDIQGGSTYSAGRGISIANDTISFSLPISAGTGVYSIAGGNVNGNYINIASARAAFAFGMTCSATTPSSFSVGYSNKASGGASANGNFAQGYMTTASGNRCHSEGLGTSSTADASHSEGYNTTASGNYSHSEGEEVKATNVAEHSQGRYNVSNKANTTWGDSGNTLFSVGNGTADNARHNAFEIRQNGDIYLTKDGQDVKLQDQLGGSSITVDTALDSGSTNPVENRVIYNKIDEVEQVTAAGLNALNDNFGGLKLVKLSQAEYNALATKDSSTLYIIVN